MMKNNVEQRIKDALTYEINNLEVNYKVSTNGFKIISDNTFNSVINNSEILKLFYHAKHSKDELSRVMLRKTLYEKMKPHFEGLNESGVSILQFSFENNKSFLRVHKPTKFNDDLSNVRYSFVYTNSKQKMVRGFEQGKISHAFRNIYPLYYKDEFLGSVDISFSSEIVQDNMIMLHDTHTHFILNKNIFKANIWERQKKVKYIQSIENDNFLFAITKSHPLNAFTDMEINLNKNLKKEIADNLKHNNSFALQDGNAIVAYLPVKNLKENKIVAYLVSYKYSEHINSIVKEYVLANIIVFIFLMIIAIVIYMNLNRRFTLEEEVNKKTKDLKYLNENLEKEVQKQNKAFETLFEKAPDGIMIFQSNEIVQCNEAVVKMMHCDSKEDILYKHPSEFSPEVQPDGFKSLDKIQIMIEVAITEGVHNFEWLHTRMDGEEFFADVTLTPISLADKDIIHVVLRDISYEKKVQKELLEQKKKLHYRANHDELTKLPNRALFNDRLSQSIKGASRQDRRFAVLFIDLDRFKQINDSLGHTIGDRVLQEISKRLKSIMRKEDTLARLGGDEFIVLMQDIKQGNDASLLADKIIEIATQPIHIDDNTLYISASIGISLYPDDGVNTQDLLMYADNAMYKAKDEGRSNYQFYSSEMTALSLSKVVMETNMRNAIKNEEFILSYQPQINGLTNEIIGMEALVRWEHPTKGLLGPNEFIPLAEETGMIVELDKWVIKTAMFQVSEWYKQGLNPGVLALNLTIKLLEDKNFIDIIKNLIDQIEYKPEHLEFEVTESQIMKDPKRAIATLLEIGSMNINIAIDDFGTGYSSLSHLKQLPIDKLKIDRSFISDIPYDEDDMSITIAIIALAKSLHLRVIAEGVETEEQKNFLLENGCVDIQGYLYAKPMLADDMVKFLQNNNAVDI